MYINDWIAWFVGHIMKAPIFFYGEMYPRRGHGGFKKFIRQTFISSFLKGCSGTLAIGAAAAEEYTKFGVRQEQIAIAPYAVDNNFFMNEKLKWRSKQDELKQELNIPATTPVVLCVAGMVPKKRHRDLLYAMSKLEIEATLVLVGHGPLLEEIRVLSADKKINVHFVGFKNQSELPKYYAMADCFVLPSEWEEFGLVINEAMCFGLPIIASDTVASTRDLVEPGGNGYTFSPGNVDKLAELLKIILNDVELRMRFGQRSLEIISTWNYERSVQGIIGLLNDTDMHAR
jgi:glycosyltransferase involved in cell wall biosynthesis